MMAENYWEEVSVSASTSSSLDDCPTPTTTTSNMSESILLRGKYISKEEEHTCEPAPVEHHPVAGKTFVIRTRKEPHLTLTLCRGELKLLTGSSPGPGAFWHCVKKDGWYGFQNSVSGTYLGHDEGDKIEAAQNHHKGWEYFMVDRDVNGGYILLMDSGNNDEKLKQVVISEEDGDRLVRNKEGGTAWDFIDIKHIPMLYGS